MMSSKKRAETDNYYVIETREGVPSLPYSVEEICGIRNSGKYGTLKRTYNELYHLYRAEKHHQPGKHEKVVVEDSNSGFQFFQGICERSGGIEEILRDPGNDIESRNYFSTPIKSCLSAGEDFR